MVQLCLAIFELYQNICKDKHQQSLSQGACFSQLRKALLLTDSVNIYYCLGLDEKVNKGENCSINTDRYPGCNNILINRQ